MVVVYPGSFDPVTYGHADIIRRAAALAEKLIIGVTVNVNKKPFFCLEKRIEFIQELTADLSNIEIKPFCGMLVDFVSKNGANAVIRGLRGLAIDEYEHQMVLANMKYSEMNGSLIETIFVLSRPEHMHISSTLAKEVVMCGGNAEDMIPISIIREIQLIYKDRYAREG